MFRRRRECRIPRPAQRRKPRTNRLSAVPDREQIDCPPRRLQGAHCFFRAPLDILGGGPDFPAERHTGRDAEIDDAPQIPCSDPALGTHLADPAGDDRSRCGGPEHRRGLKSGHSPPGLLCAKQQCDVPR
jgi:hypothetical protein